MITWNNLDTLESYKELSNVKKVNLAEVMTGPWTVAVVSSGYMFE